MRPTKLDEPTRPPGAGEDGRWHDLFDEFDAPAYGALEVSHGHRTLRRRRRDGTAGAGGAEGRGVRRAPRVATYLALSIFAALLSVCLEGVVRRGLMPRPGLGASDSPSAAERKRVVVLDQADDGTEEDEAPNRIMREVQGLDAVRREMTDAEVAAELNDPLALLVLRRNVFPATLDNLLSTLDSLNGTPGALPTQSVFLVGEGSQIQFSTASANVRRQLRFVITRQGGSNVDLLISVGAGGAPGGFLQVIGWDRVKNAFNYYERAGTATWVWLGDSDHSLRDATRGKGCFQCHINGALLMKELKLPWSNWHSQSATVSASILAPDDSLRTNRLFLQALQGGRAAQDLQRFVVEPGVRRWNVARVRKQIAADGTISDLPLLLRQVFTTTTVNLVSSTTQRSVVTASTGLPLPLSFFVNRDALFDVLQLDPGVPLPRVSGAFFLAAESRHQLSLVDSNAGFRQPGDTFFPFLVPEPSHEDLAALRQMLEQRIITPKFAACVLMVDFENPVFSPKRERLLRYVPGAGRVQNGASDVPGEFAARVEQAAAALPSDSAERLFLANWALPDEQWETVFTERLRDYLTLVNGRLGSDEGFDAFMRLAISRRFELSNVSGARNLAEFQLLLPQSNVAATAPLLEMKPDGGVGAR